MKNFFQNVMSLEKWQSKDLNLNNFKMKAPRTLYKQVPFPVSLRFAACGEMSELAEGARLEIV